MSLSFHVAPWRAVCHARQWPPLEGPDEWSRGVGQTIVDFWIAYWWQLYSAAFFGGLLFAFVAWRRASSTMRSATARRLLQILACGGGVCMASSVIVALDHPQGSPWVFALDLYDHHLGFFFVGVSAFVLLIGVYPRSAGAEPYLAERVLFDPGVTTAIRIWIAVFWVSAGSLKFLTQETLEFFHASGYSTAFFYFIAAWELGCGIALLWKRTAKLALFGLLLEMPGVIYTHYHNYFVNGAEGPFINSLDALRMMALMGILAYAMSRSTQRAAITL